MRVDRGGQATLEAPGSSHISRRPCTRQAQIHTGITGRCPDTDALILDVRTPSWMTGAERMPHTIISTSCWSRRSRRRLSKLCGANGGEHKRVRDSAAQLPPSGLAGRGRHHRALSPEAGRHGRLGSHVLRMVASTGASSSASASPAIGRPSGTLGTGRPVLKTGLKNQFMPLSNVAVPLVMAQ